jgi:hypothetical protein
MVVHHWMEVMLAGVLRILMDARILVDGEFWQRPETKMESGIIEGERKEGRNSILQT